MKQGCFKVVDVSENLSTCNLTFCDSTDDPIASLVLKDLPVGPMKLEDLRIVLKQFCEFE